MTKDMDPKAAATAIVTACEAEDDAALATILARLPDVNAALLWQGRTLTPLQIMLVSEGRSSARLAQLFAQGARADFPEANPLWAIPGYLFGDDAAELAAMVATLVAAGADIDGAPSPTTPLGEAVRAGSAAETRALLAAGADPDRRVPSAGGSDVTPLALAAAYPDVVRVLLTAGATLDHSGLPEAIRAGQSGPRAERFAATAREIATHLEK